MEQQSQDFMNQYAGFEKHPSLTAEHIREVGDSEKVEFVAEPNMVSEDRMKTSILAKKARGEKVTYDAKPMVIYTVKLSDGKKYDFWQNAKSFTIHGQIAKLMAENGGKLTGLKAKISRVSKGDKTASPFEVTKA